MTSSSITILTVLYLGSRVGIYYGVVRGDDVLVGNSGQDRLLGGADDDVLIGNAGDDVLVGGTGNDLYYFTKGFGHDTIINVGGGKDTLYLADRGYDELSLVTRKAGFNAGFCN